MPYIDSAIRVALRFEPHDTPQSAGELNYLFTVIADEYISKGKNYQRMNDVLGALDGAAREFYRRVVSPYEDTKIKENGDVYGQSNTEAELRSEGTPRETI